MLVEKSIIEKLTQKFSLQVLKIENESHKHSSGRGAESHFKVILVSDDFESLRAVARHQAVYQTLSTELENGVHALALHLYTPAEWRERGESAPLSPNCVGVGD